MKAAFFIFVVLVTSTPALSANYYLSNNGNDSQNGMSAQTAWRSLKRLSEVMAMLNPGDSILFERGGIFSGELNISGSGKPDRVIYVGAYGTGARPEINGAVEVNRWSLIRSNIWAADLEADPGNLFIDGRAQPLGRYPNEGYLPLTCVSPPCTTSLTDKHAAFADGYWNGSEVVVKSSRWTLDNIPVSYYRGKTFYFLAAASYPLKTGFGYFVQKHLETLDTPGEWFFDKTANKLFLFCKSDDKPGNHIIEAGVTGTGLSVINANYITIENLTFKNQRTTGVLMKAASNVSMRSCMVKYSGNNGIEVIACKSPAVESCQVEHSSNNGVEWSDNVNGSFVKNSVRFTGLHPGRGRSGNGTYIGLNITANTLTMGKNLFQYNSIDSTGYLGIDFRTGGTTLRKNVISHFCMVKDDGAGIYTWGNTGGGNSIEDNIVLYGVGCGAGTIDSKQVAVSGIYIDDRSSDIQINRNTVAFCGTTGIYIHNARRLSLQGNTLFDNGNHITNKERAQLSIKLDNLVQWDEGKVLQLQVNENLFVLTQEGSHCVYLQGESEKDLAALGQFNRNHYNAPHANQVVARFYAQQECDALEELTLDDWQHASQNDENSQFRIVKSVPAEPAGPELIRNGRMTNSTDGWITWPAQVSTVQDKKRGVDGPSLRVAVPSSVTEALLYFPGISLNSNKLYRLSFSAASVTKGNIVFAPLNAVAPWEAIGDYACFSTDTDFKRFTYFFKPDKSKKQARLNFKSSSSFWIDNVTLTVVVSEGKGQEPMELISNMDTEPKSIPLSGKFCDLDGNPIAQPLILPGLSTMVVQRIQ